MFAKEDGTRTLSFGLVSVEGALFKMIEAETKSKTTIFVSPSFDTHPFIVFKYSTATTKHCELRLQSASQRNQLEVSRRDMNTDFLTYLSPSQLPNLFSCCHVVPSAFWMAERRYSTKYFPLASMHVSEHVFSPDS